MLKVLAIRFFCVAFLKKNNGDADVNTGAAVIARSVNEFEGKLKCELICNFFRTLLAPLHYSVDICLELSAGVKV